MNIIKIIEDLISQDLVVPVRQPITLDTHPSLNYIVKHVEFREIGYAILAELAKLQEIEKDFKLVLARPSLLYHSDTWKMELALKYKTQVCNIKPDGKYGYEV